MSRAPVSRGDRLIRLMRGAGVTSAVRVIVDRRRAGLFWLEDQDEPYQVSDWKYTGYMVPGFQYELVEPNNPLGLAALDQSEAREEQDE